MDKSYQGENAPQPLIGLTFVFCYFFTSFVFLLFENAFVTSLIAPIVKKRNKKGQKDKKIVFPGRGGAQKFEFSSFFTFLHRKRKLTGN